MVRFPGGLKFNEVMSDGWGTKPLHIYEWYQQTTEMSSD